MIGWKLNKKSLVIEAVAASLLASGILLGYANYPRTDDGWDPGGAKTAPQISRSECPGEHRASAAKAEPPAARRPAAPSWRPITPSMQFGTAHASS